MSELRLFASTDIPSNKSVREATFEDVVAWLKTRGASELTWCVNHRQIAWEDFEERPFGEFLSRGYRCPGGAWIEGANAWDCNIELRLLVPLDSLDSEGDET